MTLEVESRPRQAGLEARVGGFAPDREQPVRRLVIEVLRRWLAANELRLAEAGGDRTWDELEAAAEGAELDVIREIARRWFQPAGRAA